MNEKNWKLIFSFQMSPIENVVPNHVDVGAEAEEIKLRNKQDRSRDLFGVQLEVCIDA